MCSAIVLSSIFSSQSSRADIVDFLFGAGKFGRKSSPIADSRCVITRIIESTRFYKDKTWRFRTVPERSPDFLSDKEFLEEMKFTKDTLGVVDTRFDKDFDTRFYFTSTAKALPDGSVPMVDPDARALVIYVHGSGTSKASGANFAGKANALSKLGYSVLSFDLPFHADGSRNPALADSANFAAYWHSIIAKFGLPGQRTLGVGHSFGPEVLAEQITRYPFALDGAVLLSPGDFNSETRRWFEEKTVYMVKTFGEVEPNNMGGYWAGVVTNNRLWNNLKSPERRDPTQVNKDLKLLLVSGEKEEYLPGELGPDGLPTDKPRDYDIGKFFRSLFSNIEVKIVPKTGHYIFNAVDEEGEDLVLSSIVHLDGLSLSRDKKMLKAEAQKIQDTRTPIDFLAQRNSKEPFLRNWLDRLAQKDGHANGQALIAHLLKENDKKTASKLLATYNQIEKQRFDALDANIKRTHDWAPDFYKENEALITRLGEKGYDASAIRAKYFALISSKPDFQVARETRVTDDVYLIPEKPARRPSGEFSEVLVADIDDREFRPGSASRSAYFY